MSNKPTKLIGKSFADFKNLVRVGKEIHLQTARLIPFYKPGDEEIKERLDRIEKKVG